MYDLSKICNLCLNDLNQLIDADSGIHNIDETIYFVIPELIILQPENFVRVCSKCLTTINDFYNFKTLCLKNNTTLLSNLNKLQTMPDDQKLQIEAIDGECTFTKAVTSSENSEELSFIAHKKNISEDDSDLEELFAYLDSNGETSNLTECASVTSDEDISETISCDNKTDSVINTKKSTDELKCLVCNRIFKRKGHFNVHLKMHKNIRDFQCSVCGKRFVRNEELKDHMYVHSDTKNFECSVCHKKFIHRVSLTRHMKIHTGYDKEYECSICEKKFTLKGSFGQHMKMHAGIKNFECVVCNWKFLRKEHLNKHMNIHSGTKDFECSVCKKKFIQNSYMKNHMKIHTGNKDFHCSICDKPFLRKEHLKSHRRRKHGIIE